ncbi:Hypothetical predicted protein [Podarcis lilfordi]|uniref:Uncharacterized protein n=1 Tax=Podarcis lilfordi TaxID=74358 RepID=A0AA35JPF1_9SAUR|nr:Hypothetical predicted protein [Podarcis lilfordi]
MVHSRHVVLLPVPSTISIPAYLCYFHHVSLHLLLILCCLRPHILGMFAHTQYCKNKTVEFWVAAGTVQASHGARSAFLTISPNLSQLVAGKTCCFLILRKV